MCTIWSYYFIFYLWVLRRVTLWFKWLHVIVLLRVPSKNLLSAIGLGTGANFGFWSMMLIYAYLEVVSHDLQLSKLLRSLCVPETHFLATPTMSFFGGWRLGPSSVKKFVPHYGEFGFWFLYHRKMWNKTINAWQNLTKMWVEWLLSFLAFCLTSIVWIFVKQTCNHDANYLALMKKAVALVKKSN